MAARRLALKCGHWRSENRLHRLAEVMLGENASLTHAGQGPTILAMLHDASISLLHLFGTRAIAASWRNFSPAIALVYTPPSTRPYALW